MVAWSARRDGAFRSFHVLACKVAGSEAAAFTKGHDSLLQPLEKLFTMAGFEWDTQLPYLSFHNSGRRLDFIAHCPFDRSRSIGGDVRVVSPMAEKYLERALEFMRKHRDFRPAKYAAPREYPMSTKHRHFRPAKYGHQGVRIREACQGLRALCNRAAPLCPTRDSQQSSLTCAVSVRSSMLPSPANC